MKKNCLVITIKTKNYGGVLQAVALQKAIKNDANDCRTLYADIGRVNKTGIKAFLSFFYQRFFLPVFGDSKRRQRTKKFLDKWLDTTPFLAQDQIGAYIATYHPDAVVVGSDQVWNDRMFSDCDAYFYPFEKPNALISYGASFGYKLSEFEPTKEHLAYIKRFDSISVREHDAAEYLASATMNATVVLDPTFLIQKETWEMVARDSAIDKTKEKYGLIYIMPGDKKSVDELMRLANVYAQRYGTSYYIIGLKDLDKFKRVKGALFGVGPAEWVHLIANAEWVLTNSFHGTVFSTLFSKPFFAVVNKNSSVNYPGRLENLLHMCNASNHLLSIEQCETAPDFMTPINGYQALKKQIEYSRRWLLDALNGDE